jgi:hypothetical protein
MGFISGARGSQSMSSTSATTAILEPQENHEWSGLALNGLYRRNKASIQRAPLHSEKCTDTAGRPDDPLYGGELQPLHDEIQP